MIFTTEKLLASIKTRALVPISQQTFLDADLIDLANEEMLIGLVPEIISARENYFLRAQSVALVTGQKEYPFPERAIGEALKVVFCVDSSGNRRKLPERSVTDLDISDSSNGGASVFFNQGDKIVLDATPRASGSLELWYYCRPSDLVLSTACARVTALTPVGANLVVSLDADLSTTLTNGNYVDFVSVSAPNRLRDLDVTIVSIGTSQITFSLTDAQDAAGVTQLAVGDLVCPAGKTNIALIPSELHPILAQMVAARVVEALGDMTKINMVNAKLAEMRNNAMKLISNRIEASGAAVNNRRGIRHHLSNGGW